MNNMTLRQLFIEELSQYLMDFAAADLTHREEALIAAIERRINAALDKLNSGRDGE